MDIFTADELCDLHDSVSNLIQDKRDYCSAEQGVEEHIARLESLRAKLASLQG
jgi:hypothetical protein